MLGNTRQIVARLAKRQTSTTKVLAMSQTKVLSVPMNRVEMRQASQHTRMVPQVLKFLYIFNL